LKILNDFTIRTFILLFYKTVLQSYILDKENKLNFKRLGMKSKLFGIAAALTKSRKFTMAIVGAQFLYLGYRYIKDKKQNKGKA